MLLVFVILSQIFASYSRHLNSPRITKNFYVPAGLESSVDFWIDIFTKYDVNELVLHDSKYNIIYEVIDVSDIKSISYFSDTVKQEIIDSRVLRVRKKYQDALMTLERKGRFVSEPFLKELFNKFLPIKERHKFLYASRLGRIRIQQGMRASFRKSIYYSRAYLKNMERIFRRFALPIELTRIPFIESFFNPKATSHKKAAGVWQFMPATGKEYMKVSSIYDERRDPYISTIAAAKMLKKAYKYLKDWSLAVTAFNYGMYGLKKAKLRTGARNIVDLINKHRGNSFGFASKNYYAEFLAALFVEKHSVEYFGHIPNPRHTVSKYVSIKKPMSFTQLSLLLGVDAKTIRKYNPAISSYFYTGAYKLPVGAKIRLPKAYVRRFYANRQLKTFFNL